MVVNNKKNLDPCCDIACQQKRGKDTAVAHSIHSTKYVLDGSFVFDSHFLRMSMRGANHHETHSPSIDIIDTGFYCSTISLYDRERRPGRGIVDAGLNALKVSERLNSNGRNGGRKGLYL